MRAAHLWAGLALALGLVGASGCTTEAYCFVCDRDANATGGSGGDPGDGSGGTGAIIDTDSGTDAGSDADAAACTDTLGDPLNCGTCGHVCALDNAFPKCENGECKIDTCAAGFVDVDADGLSCECEISGGGVELCDNLDNDCDGLVDEDFDTQTDIDHCGACNAPCSDQPNSQKACTAGVCQYTCDPGFGRPGQTGGAVTGTSDTGCPYACPVSPPISETCDGVDQDCNGAIDDGTVPGAGDSCTDGCPGGSCVGECRPGQRVCTGVASAGLVCVGGIGPSGEICDTLDNDCDGLVDEDFDTDVDTLNCGSCGITCALGDACVGGQCQFQCAPGFKDLDGNPANRCEYACPVLPEVPETCDGADQDCDGQIDDSPTDVGGTCTAQCPTANPCVAGGNCAPYAIAPQTNGCYGVCAAGGTEVCLGGVKACTFPSRVFVELCNSADDNCDGRIDEGFDLQADPFNCGACGNVCTRSHALAVACQAGACGAILACEVGYQDLDGNPANGCEYTCPVSPAVGEQCNGVDDDCDGVADNNPAGVGQACSASCPAPDPCVAAGNCTQQTSPQANGCYGVCAGDGTTTCASGAVTCNHPNRTTEACNGQDDDCDGVIDDGFDVDADVLNCGACGTVCNLANTATHQCVAGVCQVATCAPGYASVDGNTQNGCEYHCPVFPTASETCNGQDDDCDGLIDDSPSGVGVSCQSNCPGGVCTGTCTAGTSACVGGAVVCQGGQGPTLELCDTQDNDCDGSTDEGFNKQTDPLNCGTCGTVCNLPNAVEGCAAGACTIVTCNAGFANLDGNVANGCEHTCEVYPPSTEVCDGKDNDCDGKVDAADASMQTVSNFCVQTGVCAGAAPACTGATGWRCNYQTLDPRIQVTAAGTLVVTETLCDGFDNNCNTQVDETFPLGTTCDNGLLGVCRDAGVVKCDPADDTTTVCDLTPLPNASPSGTETCNGLDDDCDGTTDEGVTYAMVSVTSGATFMIDKYEASRPNASATLQGDMDGYSCSRASVMPWTSVSWATAKAACEGRGAGYRLCTAAEMAAACSANGTRTYPYSSTYAPLSCNGEDFDGNGSTGADDDVLIATGGAPLCTTANGILDLSGNATEWTSTQTGTIPGTSPVINIYQLHGGSYLSPQDGLACTIPFAPRAGANAILPSVGFRCCR